MGTSITEYALVGGGVLIVSIGGLMMLGGSVNNIFAELGSSLGHPVSPTGSTQSAEGASETQPLQGPTAAMPGNSTLQLTMPDGTTLQLVTPENIPQSIQTVGANGTTDMLASTLEGLAVQLVADGKISQTGGDAIMRLANLAHEQAGITQVIEQTMQQCNCNAQTALKTDVIYNGQSYKLSDLANLISTGSETASGTYNYGPEAAKFWSAYTNLWPAGAMKDPTSAAIIDSYVHQIANLSDTNRVILYKMNTGYGGEPADYRKSQADYMQSIGYGNTAELLQSKTGAAITNLDAKGICTTGGNRDSGAHCSR